MTKVWKRGVYPLGFLTNSAIEIHIRILLAFCLGPEDCWWSAEHIAEMVGLSGTDAAKSARKYRHRLVEKGLLEEVISASGRKAFRVVAGKATEASLTALSRSGAGIYTEDPQVAQAVKAARGKIGTGAKGWDKIPMRQSMGFYRIAPWAFDRSTQEFHDFWKWMGERVSKLKRRLKNNLPANFVTLAIIKWVINQFGSKPYPKNVKSQVAWLINLGKSFPLELLEDQRILQQLDAGLKLAEAAKAQTLHGLLHGKYHLMSDRDPGVDPEMATGPDGSKGAFTGTGKNEDSAAKVPDQATGSDWAEIPMPKTFRLHEIAPWAYDSSDDRFHSFWYRVQKKIEFLVKMNPRMSPHCVCVAMLLLVPDRWDRDGGVYPDGCVSEAVFLFKLVETMPWHYSENPVVAEEIKRYMRQGTEDCAETLRKYLGSRGPSRPVEDIIASEDQAWALASKEAAREKEDQLFASASQQHDDSDRNPDWPIFGVTPADNSVDTPDDTLHPYESDLSCPDEADDQDPEADYEGEFEG